ncbi:hypothetical protein TNCV_2678681 [Trichonephila clavipes]|nr:hypothetical protein TNCV_2678681 [Trichonephila clavipes]
MTLCPLARLVEGEERGSSPDPILGILPQKYCGTELNHSVTRTVLKAMANDRRTSSPGAFSFGRPDCKNSPQSHIVRVYDAGHGKSGVFHSAEWHVGDWSSDGIREAWLRFFIWVVSFWLG